MDKYSELLAKITALETKLNYSEDLIEKLMRLVVEGNGKPSLKSQVMMIETELKSIKDSSDKEDQVIRSMLDDIKFSLEPKKDEPKEPAKLSIILALITAFTTLGGMFMTSLPELLPFIDRRSSIETNTKYELPKHSKNV